MTQDTTVSAADIARMGDVGRAAVSNWRRRYEDFPRPVGGTASSPRFSLREVEEWLRRNGKIHQVSLADRAWQRLRTAGADLRLGELVASAGRLLTDDGGDPFADRDLVGLLTSLAADRGPADAFEFLCGRYVEAHSRRLATTPADLAALMIELVTPAGLVLDPACGLGTLLLATPDGTRAVGQDVNATSASIAETRLRLAGRDGTVAAGDSLRADAVSGVLADVVVCDPPFNERAWGYDELTADPRWEYGLPPRGESELAWVQHCLAHTRPGGLAAVLMPAAAAARRPGKRIRGNLLRAGALRAVVSLAPGGPDLWLLRRPAPGDRPPSHLLLMVADDLSAVAPAWRSHLRDPAGGTPVVELLDDDIDLSPARHGGGPTGDDLAREIATATEALRAIGLTPPVFDVPVAPQPLPETTIGELVRAGLLTLHHAPARMTIDTGDIPVLTADDLALDRPPSGRTTDEPGLVPIAPGDVVASVLGAARVMSDGGAVLGPYLARYRADPAKLDPHFLAGLLRAADPANHPGSSRTDARRTRVPRLPLHQQRRYGAVFRQLIELEDALRRATSAGETLVRLGFARLLSGDLRPGE
jgi:hypothetical protein